MTKWLSAGLAIMAGASSALCQEGVLFQDDFRGKLGPGWSWVREDPKSWRVTENCLEVRILPGNMWGPQNDAKNVLVRPVPDFSTNQVEVSVRVENKPSHQYEQVDLVCYYDDSNMVKVGEELVDGKLSVVMGREQGDKTRTIAIVPLDSATVHLKLLLKASEVRGQFRTSETNEWREVGQCDLPALPGMNPRLSLQFYQGAPDVEHWAKIRAFRVARKRE